MANRLLYIWIWIPTAAIGAMVATPADPFSIFGAMFFALPTFFAGVAWSSEMTRAARVAACFACGVVGVVLAATIWSFATWSFPDVYFPISAIVFAIANVTLGVLASRRVSHYRRRVFAALGLSYAAGVPLGPLGCMLFSIPSVLIASRGAEGRVTTP